MSTDPRIAIVREHFDVVLSDPASNLDYAETLLAKLDALPSPSGEELVERVARAIHDKKVPT